MKLRMHALAVMAMGLMFGTVPALVLSGQARDGKEVTLTGTVSDAMCGRQHMQGTSAECTRTCVSKGSKYALVIGEKIYKLETSDKTVLGLLDQQAGKNVTVTGTLNGDSIEVSKAVAAK